nr:Chain B, T-CELL SURFACE ANTIGEN CD2 [synthetic construct]
SHRPPPPGHRV